MPSIRLITQRMRGEPFRKYLIEKKTMQLKISFYLGIILFKSNGNLYFWFTRNGLISDLFNSQGVNLDDFLNEEEELRLRSWSHSNRTNLI